MARRRGNPSPLNHAYLRRFMVFGPTLLLVKNKKKKQPERKIKNKRKGRSFQGTWRPPPP